MQRKYFVVITLCKTVIFILKFIRSEESLPRQQTRPKPANNRAESSTPASWSTYRQTCSLCDAGQHETRQRDQG